jgi:hypothetical protein
MNIIISPARTVEVAQKIASIDPNWQNTFGVNDQPGTQTVRINIPPVAALDANPPAAAVAACQPFSFTLWSATTATTYAQAQAMNNNAGYTQQQLVAAITAYLATIATTS